MLCPPDDQPNLLGYEIGGMLQDWLGKMPFGEFRKTYFRKQPFSLPNAARAYVSLMTWDRLFGLMQSRPDMLVVRNGELWKGPSPESAIEARAMHAQGYSLV